MMSYPNKLCWFAALLLLATPVLASASAETKPARLGQPAVALSKVTSALGERFGADFLVHDEVASTITVGTLDPQSMTLEQFALVLDANDLLMQQHGSVYYIKRLDSARTRATPVVSSSTPSVAETEIVTVVIPVSGRKAVSLVPILRPMMPRWGHLAAEPDSNSLVVVDRYGNIERLRVLIAALEPTPETVADSR